MAIGFIVLFFESSFVQLLQTEGANEMFGMKFAEHSRYAAAGDWLGATSAQ